MNPGTFINKWIDETIEEEKVVNSVDNKAMFLTASSFDKGPENIMKVSGTKFYKLYGTNNSFSRHGQAAIQAARIIDAGGELLVKRVVADDATLANVILLAKVNTTTELPDEGEIVPNTNIEVAKQSLKWLNKSISDMIANDIVVDENGKVYGTIKFTNFKEFDSGNTENQSGFYFPFKLADSITGTNMTLKVNGVATKTDIPFDPELIFRVKPENTYEVEVDGNSIISLSFDNAKFKNSDGSIDIGNSEVEITSTTSVKWSAVYIENCYSYEQVKEEALKLYDPDNGVYPIIVITDNGRGTSNKSIKFTRNNESSLSVGKAFYDVIVYETGKKIDSINVTIDSTVYNKVQYGLDEFSSEQVKFYVDPDIFDLYIGSIADAIGEDKDTVSKYDLLNLQTIKGVTVNGLELDAESIDVGTTFGVNIQGGDNGEFGETPVETEAWEKALNDFFSGSFDISIWDTEEYKIGAVVDANYPYSVKETIAELVTYREDCMFFRDMRLDVDSYATCKQVALSEFKTNNKFIANYLTWYQIYDPSTKKRIPVTMMYDLAACLINGFDTGIHYPNAGIANNYILESAIEGSVCYTPRKTKDMDQKQMISDLRLNYAIFQSGECIVQSLYTSQEVFSQLSFVNNVLGIQEVVRSVRDSCPKKRYTFIDAGDFSDYAEDVNNVLKNFSSNFDHLSFEYYRDSTLANQKIFYGALKFAFKDWGQTELFDIYTIKNTDVNNE